MDAELERDLRAALRAFPDFPAKGILFQDVSRILADPRLLARAVDAMAAPFAGRVDKVAGIEARGFLLGVPVAQRLGVGFVPVRKAGKLPGPTRRAAYGLEYGRAEIEVQHDAFRPGERFLVVDDVLATGGTARAAAGLVEAAGATVAGHSFLLGIRALDGLSKLAPEGRAVVWV